MHRRAFLSASPGALLFASAARAAAPSTVLELFTSQGCSSCPPADALLGELARRPDVVGLAWHVDYWNSALWRDPYARPAWTQRQRSYASYLREEVYTPALVVNGAAMAVGSDSAAVARAMRTAPPPSVTVSLRRGASGTSVEIGPVPAGATALLAIYDPVRTTRVGGGENSGRLLTEYRVVREATPIADLSAGRALPPVPEDLGAVLLVQDSSWRIVGVAAIPPARPS